MENLQSTLKIAVQKSGRLNDKSLTLLQKCGIDFEAPNGRLVCPAENYPIEVMLVRDDDIPGYVRDGACDIGIVGYNEFHEQITARAALAGSAPTCEIIKNLGFGKCKLGLAVPKEESGDFSKPSDFTGMRIATSYPDSVRAFFGSQGVEVEAVEIAGSVEIGPSLGIADGVCDLISSGQTMRANGLIPVLDIYESQAVLIGKPDDLALEKKMLVDSLKMRIDGVMKASRSKYIMMNAPTASVSAIKSLVSGLEAPTILPLEGVRDRVAIHVVAGEEVFWQTMEHLKQLGATSILVVPIEKMLD